MKVILLKLISMALVSGVAAAHELRGDAMVRILFSLCRNAFILEANCKHEQLLISIDSF